MEDMRGGGSCGVGASTESTLLLLKASIPVNEDLQPQASKKSAIGLGLFV